MNEDIATIAKTTAILKQYDLYPNKGFGQNFIIEPKIVTKIAQASYIDEHTAVIEIGPGIGALTQQLAKLAKKVLAFEIDKKLITVLDDTLNGYDNVTIINQDFLLCDLKYYYQALIKEVDKVVITANLPYYITTAIIFKIIESDIDIEYMTLMVQKEMAERFMAKANTKDYNALSVILQYQYEITTVMKVSSNVFIPKPAVESIVVQFKKRIQKDKIDQSIFFTLIKACFSQRRKTIYNNLKAYYNDESLVLALLAKTGIDKQRRAESLVLNDFIRLYQVQYED
ncbi:MAG: 16S rRNA (adenine(1518)-N(6)/adenine(1519)-N(6))-dimethyltransferase RsmA [Erysipelotrichaceae bacterium]|nr:16S rRNA (adenine(1518)-N(6)/adenine(1519)-N(6))-dimethyltransferase RsmA [Erysipelotrichaceae bacterium]